MYREIAAEMSLQASTYTYMEEIFVILALPPPSKWTYASDNYLEELLKKTQFFMQ